MTLTADERRQRIRKLERELSELRREGGEPLTLAEIREMTPEQVEEEWERVKPTLSRLNEQEEKPPTTPAEARARASRRISRGLDPDAAAVRRRRRNLEEESHDDDDE